MEISQYRLLLQVLTLTESAWFWEFSGGWDICAYIYVCVCIQLYNSKFLVVIACGMNYNGLTPTVIEPEPIRSCFPQTKINCMTRHRIFSYEISQTILTTKKVLSSCANCGEKSKSYCQIVSILRTHTHTHTI